MNSGVAGQVWAWARARVRTAVVIRPRAMVARAEASRVPRAPRAATRGPPKAVPVGPARVGRELRAARTWASVPGGWRLEDAHGQGHPGAEDEPAGEERGQPRPQRRGQAEREQGQAPGEQAAKHR